ncbi:carbamoyltransferase HypF [Clostridium folliculivorans]|uniref:Carbamoyltransferase n=1 Tax=Clostridium folliculivorans TaxID=2886038 RepID=A0A9W6DBH0_9CLOT|nr:carbamoyltransferase HypF [Clostridium folliculivorans]GKU25907.1 carbamoyltransferase [Clostridium folliculivorans]GKU27993.1 carbamoyltransferase [Clostridium folliculivorans]
MRRVFINVQGIVQGVGFRPFVYKKAIDLELKGWVNNNSEGVYIDIEGDTDSIYQFLKELRNNPPALSKVENISTQEKPLIGYEVFDVRESEKVKEKITLISPDVSICKDCTDELLDRDNRRYRYPFTNCTNCGPRFSIIKDIPYDRDKTTMKSFVMCPQCEGEYRNVKDRRFHAEPNACSDCGPSLWIEDKCGNIIDTKDHIKWTQNKLKEGNLFAIKGVGGFHLVCDAKNGEVIEKLRHRKRRPHKPLATMAKDMSTISKYCKVDEVERQILEGITKPIVILNRNDQYNLPESIAPYQKTLGVMIPYTPLHMVLFDDELDMLIMTSANTNGLPIEYNNQGARDSLKDVVDYFLMNDREIHIPVDDSVVQVVDGKIRMIRRARGYVPEPFRFNGVENILACGSNMKNTFSFTKENFLFVSQYNGDLENVQTLNHYENNIEHFKKIFTFKPSYIVHDLHPTYLSTQYALKHSVRKIAVQHHHAHIASCMMENNLRSTVIGVCFDGTGYGVDGEIWGGEFLICDMKEFKRIAHLDYVKLPGGDKAIREPWRIGVAYINKSLTESFKFQHKINRKDSIDSIRSTIYKIFGERGLTLLRILNSSFSFPLTSSMGRLFDAVASILEIRDIVTYEGQASMELEACLQEGVEGSYTYEIVEGELSIIKTYSIITQILDDMISGLSKGIISAKFHNTIINFTVDMCMKVSTFSGLKEVALSGGVFQNSYLLRNIIKRLKDNDFNVYTQSSIPCNDGGISVGQLCIANEIIKNSNFNKA